MECSYNNKITVLDIYLIHNNLTEMCKCFQKYNLQSKDMTLITSTGLIMVRSTNITERIKYQFSLIQLNWYKRCTYDYCELEQYKEVLSQS